MANNLAKTSAQTPATMSDVDPFEEFVKEHGRQSFINGDLLRFTKHGAWKAGPEQEVVEDGTRMMAFIPGLTKGWVRWEDNKPVENLVGLVAEGFKPPKRDDLGNLDKDMWPKLGGKPNDPWQYTFYLPMLDEHGQLYTYVTSSNGGEQTLSNLIRVYNDHKKQKPKEIPIVQLNATSYPHPEYGETFKPILKPDGWGNIPADFAELKASMDDDDQDDIQDREPETFVTKSITKAAPKEKEKEKEKQKVVPMRGNKGAPNKKSTRF
jgi:hypothetical protein